MDYDRDTLISNHMQLAENIAGREWRTATHALRLDDMLSLAYMGLLDAAIRWIPYCEKNSYDPAATQYFKVFASLRIRGTIRDYLRQEDWATRTLRTKAKKLKEAGQDEGIPMDQLAEKTGMTVAEINKVMAKLAARPVSLDAYAFNANNHQEKPPSQAGAELKDPVDTEGSAFVNDINSVFVATYAQLSDEYKVIIALHYYLKKDLRSIAQELGITESRVSQLHASAVLIIQDAVTKAAKESGIHA